MAIVDAQTRARAGANTGWHVQTFRGHGGLQALASDWKRLVDRMERSGFEHDHATHGAYFKHLSASGGEFLVLALADDSGVRAICPVEVRNEKVFRRATPTWGLAPSHLYGIALDWICPADDALAQLLPRVMRHLAQQPGGPRWFFHDRVIEGSVIWQGLAALDPGQYCLRSNGARDMLDCDQGFEALASNFSYKHGRNVAAARRRLARLGPARLERVSTQPELDGALEQFVELEATGWKGAGEQRGALRFHPDQLGFYRELVSTLGMLGRCEVHRLMVGERCIGSVLCFRNGRELAALKVCYDEREASSSPGILVMQAAAEHGCEDPGIDRLDMISHRDWLRGWRPQVTPAHALHVSLHGATAALWTRLLRLRLDQGPMARRWLGALRPERPHAAAEAP